MAVRLDRKPKQERRRQQTKIILLMRWDFRTLFGLSFCEKWGFFVDHQLSGMLSDLLQSVRYPLEDRRVRAHLEHTRSVTVSSDGHYLFTGLTDGSISVWELVSLNKEHKWKAHEKKVRAIAYKPGTLVSGSLDCSIRVWNPVDCSLIWIMEGHTGEVLSVDFDTDRGTHLVSGSSDCSIRVWSLETGLCERVLNGHSRYVKSPFFMSKSDCIISGSGDRSLRIWDPTNGECLRIIEDGIGQCLDMSVNCDRTRVVCTFLSGFIVLGWPSMTEVWDCRDNAYRVRFHPLLKDVFVITDSAVGSPTKVKLFDLSKRKCIRSFEGSADTIEKPCFTPDGSLLIGVDQKGCINVWNVSDLFSSSK